MATKDPYRFFRIEAAELQDQLGAGILALEKGEDPNTLALLLRLAHTLKGAARVVRQLEIAEHAHALEDILTPLRDNNAKAERSQIDALLALHDQIIARVAALGAPGSTPSNPVVSTPAAAAPTPAASTPVAPAAVEDTRAPKPVAAQPDGAGPQAASATSASAAAVAAPAARADDGEMDTLLDAVSQAHRQLALLRRGLAQAQRASNLAQTLALRLATESASAAGTKVSERRALAQELSGLLSGFDQGYETSLYQMDRELEQVRDSAERLRLTPAARLFVPLQRAARDAAQALGKDVGFAGLGGDVRLEGEVLNLVQGALMQMVRNAVAHGIEPVAQRLAAGKPTQGQVTVSVLRQGRRVAFECGDDGAGLDLDALRSKARLKGWVSEGADDLDAQTLLQFLLRGGISTARQVNELAGRGVGLDVVRDAAERLGGEVRVRTGAGRGTTLSLIVPLRMAALEVLQIEAGGVPQSVPLDAVKQTLRLLPQDIAISAQACSIAYQGQTVPYASLAEAIRGSGSGDRDGVVHRPNAVLVQGNVDGKPSLAALAVDRIIGTAYVTLRAPPELMPAHELLAGVSVDVEGRPQLVLDPDGLCAFARANLPKARAQEEQQLPILVIDDSLTTRMLEQSILESAGYTVHAAVSAEEGL